ncbi:hypothetical protein IM40_06195 [Candidatus Paracaedimonas acanthamoebae]|nr:hypothetical protein IM40_06195 [Candidatus Paracaedimonas acanthamoebae]
MFTIEITYFLMPDGLSSFSSWYKDVMEAVRQQDGFISMVCNTVDLHPTVTLSFSSEEKLDKWASTEKHDELFAKIEAYFVKPVAVKFL